MRNQTHNRKRIAIDISLSFDQFMALQGWVERFSESDFFSWVFSKWKREAIAFFKPPIVTEKELSLFYEVHESIQSIVCILLPLNNYIVQLPWSENNKLQITKHHSLSIQKYIKYYIVYIIFVSYNKNIYFIFIFHKNIYKILLTISHRILKFTMQIKCLFRSEINFI